MQYAVKETLVEYDSEDQFAKVLAYISLAPILIGVAHLAITYAYRNLNSAIFLAGQGVSLLVNKFLKETIQQDRPNIVKFAIKTRKTYGMPSDHVQYMSFFAIYFMLFTVTLRRYKDELFIDSVIKVIEVFAALFLTVLVGISRVYLGYHTVNQVFVGGIVGTSLALTWWGFSQWIFHSQAARLRNYFPRFFNVKQKVQ